MRLGPIEKQILKKLVPGEFISPLVFLGDRFRGCSSLQSTVHRLVYEKKLAVFRYQTYSPEEAKYFYAALNPGLEALEFNGALKLTEDGEKVWQSLTGNIPGEF